jgi:hypothetical protein
VYGLHAWGAGSASQTFGCTMSDSHTIRGWPGVLMVIPRTHPTQLVQNTFPPSRLDMQGKQLTMFGPAAPSAPPVTLGSTVRLVFFPGKQRPGVPLTSCIFFARPQGLAQKVILVQKINTRLVFVSSNLTLLLGLRMLAPRFFVGFVSCNYRGANLPSRVSDALLPKTRGLRGPG